jgi:competence protein ComGC
VIRGNEGFSRVQKRLNTEKDKRKKSIWLIPLLILSFLILLILRNCHQRETLTVENLRGNDTLKTVVDTSVKNVDTIVDTSDHVEARVADSTKKVLDREGQYKKSQYS